jgi:hypothetical protein
MFLDQSPASLLALLAQSMLGLRLRGYSDSYPVNGRAAYAAAACALSFAASTAR